MNTAENQKKNWSHWFEIPVSDMQRAKTFYENCFETKLEILDLGPITMGVFPHLEVGCALCLNPFYQPSQSGVLVYMDASPDLNHVLQRIEQSGGTVMQAKKQISPELGYMALFIDSEGNRLALTSPE